jgi:hypothetical protein
MLINCVAYQNGVKLAEPSIEDIHEYLKQPDCLIWVALIVITVCNFLYLHFKRSDWL